MAGHPQMGLGASRGAACKVPLGLNLEENVLNKRFHQSVPIMRETRARFFCVVSRLLGRGLPVLCLAWWTALAPLQALGQSGDDGTIRIGVLSYQSLEETRATWTPTAAWLETRIPGHRFRIVPMYFEELGRAVAEQQVGFVLCNPEKYVLLHADHGLSAIATLMPLVEGHPFNRFGGVIFTRADRADIKRLTDLKGKRVSTVSQESMGGYLAQHWTLYKAGVDPRRDLTVQFTGMPHDNVVEEVLSGRADAGFVRTGVLEQNIRKGRLQASAIRVLNSQEVTGFRQRLSTDLYPEWPFAAMPGQDPQLKKDVALALLGMEPDSEAATKGGYYGFSPPANYAEVEALMVRLDLHPYKKDFGWWDVFEKYALGIVALLLFVVMAAVFATRKLRRTNRALNTALDTTDELARQRTLLLASLGEGVYGTDRSGNCTFINPAALAMLRFELSEVLGRDQHALFHHHKPDGSVYSHEECPIHKTLEDGVRREVAETFIRKNGEPFPVRMTVTPIQEYGETMGAVVVFQDTTDETLRLKRMRLLDAALKAADNGIVITDLDGVIEWVNPAVLRLTGYRVEEAVGQKTSLLRSGTHDESFYKGMWQTILSGEVWHGDMVNKRKDGSLYNEEMTITPVMDDHGTIQHFIAVKQDISKRKQLEEELHQLATTDSLTGVANRRHFLKRVAEELKRIKRYGGHCALIMLDLDHFKRINDSRGHAAGDSVLCHFTSLVQDHLRGSDLLGRLGGEEFAVFLPETALEGAVGLAERVRRHTESEPANSEKGQVSYTVSVGVTLLDPLDASPDDALARADEALYRAKANGRNRVEQQLTEGHAEPQQALWDKDLGTPHEPRQG